MICNQTLQLTLDPVVTFAAAKMSPGSSATELGCYSDGISY